MTRKTWSTVDVSAYVDGELTPEVQVAFETTVSQNPDLRHRVAEMRQVVALMRAVPLQEPPRNYLLTPAMVTGTEARPRIQRRRLPLLMMRIATSVAAAAFVVVSGLTLMQRGISPAMITQSRDAPEAAIVLEQEAAGDEMEILAAPMAQPVPVEESAEAEGAAPAAPEVEKAVEREVEVAEEVVADAPAEPAFSVQDTENIEEPSLGDDEEGPALGMGMGGGVEELSPEGDADSSEAATEVTDIANSTAPGVSVPDDVDTPQNETMQTEAEAAVDREETMTAQAPVAPAEATQELTVKDDSDTVVRAMPQDGEAPEMAREAIETTDATPRNTGAAPAVGPPIGLGVLTAALAAITFWLSRRQLD